MVTICMWCHRLKDNDKWISAPIPDHEQVSHGLCPDCFEKWEEKNRKDRIKRALGQK